MSTFSFDFDPQIARWNRLFGVRPETAKFTVDGDRLRAEFGPWTVETALGNIASVSTTGPYRPWRVAGPARMSLADGGMTFATNARLGLCVTFAEPVRGIEPSGILRHPSVTVTVGDIEGLAARLGFPGPLEHIGTAKGSLRGVLIALRHHSRRARNLADTDRRPPTPMPPLPDDAPADLQPLDAGVGPWFHRRYTIEVDDPALSAEELIALVRADPNVISDASLAPFVKDHGADGSMAVGDRYTVTTAGPWSGPVEVVDVGPRHLRLATLEGHMEAGLIDMHAAQFGARLTFEIESWARSGDRSFHILYDTIGVAKAVQTEQWIAACERAAERAGGSPGGPVQVTEQRSEQRPAWVVVSS